MQMMLPPVLDACCGPRMMWFDGKDRRALSLSTNDRKLCIAPGLGLSAWIENGCLQLAQGDDVVALSQTEAKVLFAQFDEWVRS